MNDIVMIPVTDLRPHPDNPRKDVGDVRDLAESIRAQGIRQNLLVVPLGVQEGRDTYRVVIGHRRLAAARLAGLSEVPCAVADLDARGQMELMIVENSQRSDLKPIEEADAYQGLLDLGMSRGDIAMRTGRSAAYVRSRLKVASIPERTRARARDFGQLSLSDLEAVAEFGDDAKTQERLIEVAGTSSWDWELNRARDNRHEKRWMADAIDWINVQGLAMLPEAVKLPDSAWMDPKGYVARHRYRPNHDGSFESQWRSDHTDRQLLSIRDGQIVAYLPAKEREPSPYELEEKRREKERRDREKPVRLFADTSRKLRLAWMSSNHHRIGKTLTAALVGLSSEDLLGYSDYGFGTPWGADYEDRMIVVYDAISATPLPVTVKDVKHGVYHLGVRENIAELRRRAGESPRVELLLLLMARREAHIDYTTWMSPDLKPLRDYYEHLGALGYPVSDEEQAALDGKYQNKEQES